MIELLVNKPVIGQLSEIVKEIINNNGGLEINYIQVSTKILYRGAKIWKLSSDSLWNADNCTIQNYSFGHCLQEK